MRKNLETNFITAEKLLEAEKYMNIRLRDIKTIGELEKTLSVKLDAKILKETINRLNYQKEIVMSMFAQPFDDIPLIMEIFMVIKEFNKNIKNYKKFKLYNTTVMYGIGELINEDLWRNFYEKK